MPNIKVGSRVTCVDDTGFATSYGEKLPVKGRTYMVRNILTSNSVTCLRLVEIVNAPAAYAQGTTECSFRANRFVIKRGR